MIQSKKEKNFSLGKAEKYPAQIAYFNAGSEQSAYDLKESLLGMFRLHRIRFREFIILCIGSDRSTGDSLGPLIGYKLEKYHIPGVSVCGTLDNPVHAANLSERLADIYRASKNPFILAIDASLGTKEHIGYVTLANGPLRPGLGVKKELPNVGDIHITGIVNFSGMMESLLLQTTRLSMVMQLADTISKAVLYGVTEFFDV